MDETETMHDPNDPQAGLPRDPETRRITSGGGDGYERRVNVEVIFTVKDEEMNLPYSIPAVKGWADRVWVVDSGSTDRTEEIVREHGCEFVYQPWLGYARQKNWALDNLDLKADWILIVDADEAVQEDLKELMAEAAAKESKEGDPVAYYINRYFIFLGKRIRHCGYYPSWNIRFFKRGTTRYEERNVHEHMVPNGPKEYMHGHLEHYDRRSLQNYMAKHNKYSTLEAVEVYKWIKGQSTEETEARLFGTPLERRRWIKHYIYPGLPVKWLFRFMFMYFVKLGFLDGLNGFRFSLFITAYELLIDLKLREIKLMEKEGRLDLEAYASE